MRTSINLNGKVIRKESNDFYFIAEIGTNYIEISEKEEISSFVVAERMIREAANCGVDAVKFQIYEAENLANRKKVKNQFEYLKKHEAFDFGFYSYLMDICKEVKVEFIATLFTDKSIETFGSYLNILKVASSDITNKPMLKKLGKFKKPILLSTAGSTLQEISNSLDWIGHDRVALLHCTGNYPTEQGNVNFAMIRNMNNYFPNVIGYSDHIKPETLDNSPLYAFLLGANIIEKHFTTDRTLTNNDHIHSYSPAFLSSNIKKLKEAQKFLGEYNKKPTESEKDFIMFGRRSLAVKKDVEKGERLSFENIISIRPGTGISPSEIDNIIGKKANKKIDKNSIIEYNMVEEQ